MGKQLCGMLERQDASAMFYRILPFSSSRKGAVLFVRKGGSAVVSSAEKIRNEGDGAKLISSNDEQNFTFRGRFSDKSQAFSIGYEDSQKAHKCFEVDYPQAGVQLGTACMW